MFFGKDQPESEGSRYADPGIRSLPGRSEGQGRGWSVREKRCGRGQEVVTSWRTVEKAIMRSHHPRHAQRSGP